MVNNNLSHLTHFTTRTIVSRAQQNVNWGIPISQSLAILAHNQHVIVASIFLNICRWLKVISTKT